MRKAGKRHPAQQAAPQTYPVTQAEHTRLRAQTAVASGEAEPIITQGGEVVFFWADAYEPETTPRMDMLDGQRRWIANGEDNLMPHSIIDMGRLSTTHAAILGKKAEFIAGSAINYTDPALAEFCKRMDKDNGLHALLEKCAEDYLAFGAFCLQIRWKKYKKEIFDFRHQPYHEVRKGFAERRNDNGEYDQGVWLCQDWPNWNWGRKYDKPEFFHYFEPHNWEPEPTFLITSRYTMGNRYYALPYYFSSFKDILTEIEIVNYKFWSVSRGFNPAGILRVFGKTTDQNVIDTKQQVKNLSGSTHAGKVMVAVTEQRGDANSVAPVEWIPFNNNPASADVTSYLEQARQAIVTGHRLASATVIGINVSTGLQSDANTLYLAMEELKRSVKKDQTKILDVLRGLLVQCGFPNPQFEVMDNIPSLAAVPQQQANSGA